MTVAEAVILYQKLDELAGRENLKLPTKLAFKFLRNAKILEPTIQAFNEARTNVIKAYTEPSKENPDEVIVPEDKVGEVNKEIEALGAEPYDTNLVMISLDDLDGLDMTIQDLAAIYPIINCEEA